MRTLFILQIAFIAGVVILSGIASPLAAVVQTLLTIGGRDIAGPYYPTAGAIASAVNKKYETYGRRIMVKAGPSSVAGLDAVMAGEVDFALVQLVGIFRADKQTTGRQDILPQNLCSVFNAHAEIISLIASAKSGIVSVRDLKGRRVGIGSPGSDLHYNSVDILAAAGIAYKSDLAAAADRVEAFPGLLQAGEIDAFFFPAGTMSRSFLDLLSGPQKVRLVSIAAPGISELTAANPFYEKALVKPALYPSLDESAETEAIGVKTCLVTRCGKPAKTVYMVAKETFENLSPFKKRHPASNVMSVKAMVAGLPAPVHPGASKYYQETGLQAIVQP